MHTFTSALALIGVAVPPHLEADADVPVLCAPQAQGDLLVLPATPPAEARWQELPESGVQVVHGEATGNTHWLHRGFDSPEVCWAPLEVTSSGETTLVLGYIWVPPEQSALLIHTDEHGANGIGPGTYAIHRKRQLQLATARPARVVTSRPDPTRPSTVVPRRSLYDHGAAAWDYVMD